MTTNKKLTMIGLKGRRKKNIYIYKDFHGACWSLGFIEFEIFNEAKYFISQNS